MSMAKLTSRRSGQQTMTIDVIRKNLGDCQNEPVIQDQVIAYMEQIGAPMLLREIYRPLHLPKVSVKRVLGRLHAKGILTRWKIPVRRQRPGRLEHPAPQDSATMHCYLYAFAEAPPS